MKRALIAWVLVACSAAVPAPTTSASDATRWRALGDWLCSRAGGVEYGSKDDVSVAVARRAFFGEKDAKIKAQVGPLLEKVVTVLRDLPRGAQLVVTVTMEEEAHDMTLVARDDLAHDRSTALTAALVHAGLGRADFVVRAPTTQWEGDYDGPAALDPAEGHVVFAVVR